MNDTLTHTNTDKKALAQKWLEAYDAKTAKYRAYQAIETIADANKTPTGKHKKAFKQPLFTALDEYTQQKRVVESLVQEIEQIAINERKANTALTEARKSERIQAIENAFMNAAFAIEDVTLEWGNHYAAWLVHKEYKDKTNHYLNGKCVVFKLAQDAEFETHLRIVFDELGGFRDVVIHSGLRNPSGQSWNLIDRNVEIECLSWSDEIHLYSFRGTEEFIKRYIKILQLTLVTKKAIKPYPREHFHDTFKFDETVAEWANL